MNSPSSKLNSKLPSSLILSTVIWFTAIGLIVPSYAQIAYLDDLPTLGSNAFQFEGTQSGDSTERFLAEYGQNAANFVSEEKKQKKLADMAQDYARHKAANIATDEITHWLSKAGNTRLNINLNEKLSIKTSQLDWLVPWYDQHDFLLFSQHSIHRTDGRLQSNNGIGLRHFHQNSMVGINAFFDHDLSHYHSRLGLGLEYAQDYARVSTNSYLGLSTWRSASELAHDYYVRPANGWDIQLEGWLPAYSNLGANLKLEQYYGDDVALFGTNERQKNPMAATVGVNWSPFPLLALNVEHRIGNNGANETGAKIAFNWLLGRSLEQHLDTSVIEANRHIPNNRYDFVNRNNNIVLEYQKKTLISLSLPKVIQGVTGEERSIIRNLTTKYPIEKIVVDAPELIAAGGRLHLNGIDSSVKLPSYKITNNALKNQQLNLYRLTVTVYDTKGNVSPQVETLIEVTGTGALTITHENTKKRNNGIADGKDANTFAIVIKDPLGHPVPNAKVNFVLPANLRSIDQKNTGYYSLLNHFMWKAKAKKAVSEQKYNIIANDKGEASIQFTTFISGSYVVKANTEYGPEINEMYHFKPDISQSFISSIDIIRNNVAADGISKNKIKLRIINNSRQSIAGALVHFEASNGIISPANLTDEYGNTELEISSLVEGSIDIIATLNGDSRTIQVNFLKYAPTSYIQPSTESLFKPSINEQNRHTSLSLLRELFQKIG